MARQEIGQATLNGKVYATGGLTLSRGSTDTVEVYDASTDRWTPGVRLPTRRHHHGFCALGNKLYLIGGYVTGFTGVADCWSFDPAAPANGWTRIADLPRPRGALVAVAANHRIYAIGGVVPRVGTVPDLTVYDPATNRWTTAAPMPTAREHLAGALLGTRIIAVGGRAGGQLRDACEAYDPITGRWSVLPPLPTPRGGNGAAVLDGKLLVVGGESSRNYPETEEYDPATNRWRRIADMAVAMHGIYPSVIGDEMLVAGGGLRPGYAASPVVQVFRYLPSDVERFGQSTPACSGAIRLSVDRGPIAGTTVGLVTTATGPPNSTAAVWIAGTDNRPGLAILGIRWHLGLSAPLLGVMVNTGSSGNARLSVPIPIGSRGTVYAQAVFLNTAACGLPARLSASDALVLTVR